MITAIRETAGAVMFDVLVQPREVITGASSRRKTLRVTGVTASVLAERIVKRAVLAAMLGGACAGACALGACDGSDGTITLSLVTAPNSTVLDNAQTLHVTLTEPAESFDVMRSNGTFLLEFDTDASGSNGIMRVDAYDGSNTLLAVGATPPLPIAAITSDVTIYMAPPLSLAASPVAISPAVSDLSAGALSYGAIFAGGLDATGASSDENNIYNVYDHSLTPGLALPTPAAGVGLGVGSSGYVYFFGGDASGSPGADLERFDTTAAPNGAYDDLSDMATYARVGAALLPLGDDEFIITGTPVLDFSGIDATLASRTDVTSLPAAGVTVTPATDGINVTLAVGSGAGSGGIESLRANVFTSLSDPGALRIGHSVVAGPNATAIVIGGSIAGTLTADALVIDAAASTTSTTANVLATPRSNAAVATTDRYLVVAGGTDASGAVLASAEIFDVTTLAPVATATMVVPRTNATATALANGQIVIAGGVDANGAPTSTLELFTPDDPPQ